MNIRGMGQEAHPKTRPYCLPQPIKLHNGKIMDEKLGSRKERQPFSAGSSLQSTI